jgi:hypothetical protein
MDRPIVYPGQIPLETDLLNTNRFAMIGLAKLAAAILGTATQVSGFAATPDSPASMNVKIGSGEIYALANLDGTAYSSLAADTAHQILKQGIMLDSVLLPLTAPTTVGQSINYLIQASLQETDTGAVVLPYYNSANPAVAYSGPNNTGAAQATTRKCGVVVSAKAGVAATTGSQISPAADADFVGMWVVTVAYGQTTITAPNIAAFASAPTVTNLTLLAKQSQILGVGQTWQNVLASRSLGVTYYNTTTRPIYVVASCNWVTSGGVNVSVGGVNQSQGATAGATGSFQFPAMAIVPPGQGYVITGGTLVSWFELR